jgi:CheY-like chemotaxis protein
MANVLLVDDHPDLRDVVTELLELHGHRVQVCVDGEAAVALLDREPPDAVIADDRLPGISGVELLRTIRSHPRLATIPVIIFSADEAPRVAVLFDGLERLGQRLQSR